MSKWTLDIARGDYDSEAEESDVDGIEEDMERQLADGQDDPYSNDLETGFCYKLHKHALHKTLA